MNEENQVCMNKKTVKEIVNTFVAVTFVLDNISFLKEANDLNRKIIELNQQIQREL